MDSDIRDALIQQIVQDDSPDARLEILRQLLDHAADDEVVFLAVVDRAGNDSNTKVRGLALDWLLTDDFEEALRDKYRLDVVAAATKAAKVPGAVEWSERVAALRLIAREAGSSDIEAAGAVLAHLAWTPAAASWDEDARTASEAANRRIERWLAQSSSNPTIQQAIVANLSASNPDRRAAAARVLGQAATLRAEAIRDASVAEASIASTNDAALQLLPDPHERNEAEHLLDALSEALHRLADTSTDDALSNAIYEEILPLVEAVRAEVSGETEASETLTRSRIRAALNAQNAAGMAKGVGLGVSAVGNADEAGENIAAAGRGVVEAAEGAYAVVRMLFEAGRHLLD